MTMGNSFFKTQKEYIRYLKWRRRVVQIVTILSIILLFLYILISNPHSFAAWLFFAAYVLFMMILDYHAKQEFLKNDTETAKKEAQARLEHQNRKRISKRK